MSLKVIQNEIIKFINTQNPEVLAIQGVLGNGKTFFWKKTLKEMKFSPGVFTKYSYVSLFGINSLDELKNAIFSSTLPFKDVGKEPSIETLNFNIMSLYPPSKKKWRGWMSKIINGIPVLKNFREVIDSAIYLSLQNTIICLDDIEKKGDRLTIKEVMGLISFLKEQRNCKVAIIYNEDRIDLENKEQLLVLKEKVIDKNIEFSLTSEECCDISLGA